MSEVIDVWAKRNARLHAADSGLEHRRLLVEDALREVAYSVRSAFADVLREQSDLALSNETQGRYQETVRLSRARFAAGDISEAELKKVELEGMRYLNQVTDAEMQLAEARQKLASLLALGWASALPQVIEPEPQRLRFRADALLEQAMKERPDVRAVRSALEVAEANVGLERRLALPDLSLGVAFTHSGFVVSGDNPNSLL